MRITFEWKSYHERLTIQPIERIEKSYKRAKSPGNDQVTKIHTNDNFPGNDQVMTLSVHHIVFYQNFKKCENCWMGGVELRIERFYPINCSLID